MNEAEAELETGHCPSNSFCCLFYNCRQKEKKEDISIRNTAFTAYGHFKILLLCSFTSQSPIKIRAIVVFVGMSRKSTIILDNSKDSSFQRKCTMDTFQACTFAVLCKDQHSPVEPFTKRSSQTAVSLPYTFYNI